MRKIKDHSDTDILDAKVPQEKIAQLYDGTAWFYDIWATLTETKAQDKAIQLANIQDKAVILDVAVGTGKLFNRIVKRNPNGRNVGIDISNGMLEKAKLRLSKQSNSNYSLDIGSAFNITVDNQSVDILFNNYMFDLIPFNQMDAIINEFSRVLKSNGKLVLVNMTKAEYFGAGLYEKIYRISPTLLGGCRGVQLSDLLADHGFIIEKREYIQQMLFPSEVILATK
jgi:ubiquinone/menaquinone biosynthesis C-methylase UbiE